MSTPTNLPEPSDTVRLGKRRGAKLGSYTSATDLVLGLLLLAVGIGFPMVMGIGDYANSVLQLVCIFIVLAVGLNVVVGYTGLLDLGYVTFPATGAVLAAWMCTLVWPMQTADLGITLDGTTITAVDAKSAANQARLRPGDKVLAYGEETELRPVPPGGEVGVAGPVKTLTFFARGDEIITVVHVPVAQLVESPGDLQSLLNGRQLRKTVALLVDRSGSLKRVRLQGTLLDQKATYVWGFDGSYLIILLIAGCCCGLLGVLRGFPTLRVTGDYYAIVTLGLAEVAYEIFLWSDTDPVNLSSITGGAFGIKLEEASRPVLFGQKLYYDSWPFHLTLILCVGIALIAAHHLNRSRVGRAWAAIRVDETAARAVGVKVGRYKLIAFAFSGFLGGIGGALYAMWSGTVAVKSLDVWQSILVLACVVLGGMGSLRGVVAGTIVLMSLGEVLRIRELGVPPEARFLVYGVVLIVFMRFRPQGFLPPQRRGRELDDSERHRLATSPAPLFALHTEAETIQAEGGPKND